MRLTFIAALDDNYIWILHNQQKAIVIDPGQAAVVADFLTKQHLQLAALLITHHHWDHTDGVAELYAKFKPQIIAPDRADVIKLPFLNANETEQVNIAGLKVQILQTPGHTLTHCCYVIKADEESSPLLFSGDTLFAAGCGKIFEGTAEQMLSSLKQLLQLPSNTRLCSGHNYLLSNLRFAAAVEPENRDIVHYVRRCATNSWGVITTLEQEKLINPFLRTSYPAVRQRVEQHYNRRFDSEVEVFAALRQWKNDFRGSR